jgi:hypothetical protein
MRDVRQVTEPSRLFERAAELVDEIFRDLAIPSFFRTDLSREQQTHERGKPLPYLTVTMELIAFFGLKTVVEIGSMRGPMPHRLDEFNPECCNDGHSTLHFASTGAEVFTVDIDPRSAAVLEPYRAEFPNLRVATQDGIVYLRAFRQRIDVLYLDAWDVVAGTGYAEQHLDAYRAALPSLSPRCIVQIDDTDILNGGKGRLLIPQMIRDGFHLVTWGRQAILVRD